MNFVGAIGTVAALANYRKAKAEYEALKEQQDGLVAAIQTYNSSKYDEYINQQADSNNEIPDGVETTTILRVGNLIGSVFRVQPSVILSNTSNRTYYIRSVSARFFFQELPILIHSLEWDGFDFDFDKLSDSIIVDADLLPGQTREIQFEKGLSVLTKEGMEQMRDLICNAAGKSLITSCPKLSIENVEKANIKVIYTEDGENQPKTYFYNGKPGVLRYCGEAYL
jgi:hypothetical protein